MIIKWLYCKLCTIDRSMMWRNKRQHVFKYAAVKQQEDGQWTCGEKKRTLFDRAWKGKRTCESWIINTLCFFHVRDVYKKCKKSSALQVSLHNFETCAIHSGLLKQNSLIWFRNDLDNITAPKFDHSTSAFLLRFQSYITLTIYISSGPKMSLIKSLAQEHLIPPDLMDRVG